LLQQAKEPSDAYPPQIKDMGDKKWKELAVKDLEGYVIVFGGGN